jgi:hypothetical protein
MLTSFFIEWLFYNFFTPNAVGSDGIINPDDIGTGFIYLE